MKHGNLTFSLYAGCMIHCKIGFLNFITTSPLINIFIWFLKPLSGCFIISLTVIAKIASITGQKHYNLKHDILKTWNIITIFMLLANTMHVQTDVEFIRTYGNFSQYQKDQCLTENHIPNDGLIVISRIILAYYCKCCNFIGCSTCYQFLDR